LDIIINGQAVDVLSSIVHRDSAQVVARKILVNLKKNIPRHLFTVVIQASLNNKIIGREEVPPYRKNVTGKCYGGDITRKRKLWEKQKEGKKRMKTVGSVQIPEKAFLSLYRSAAGN
jgi:GTP-binding protein LepA